MANQIQTALEAKGYELLAQSDTEITFKGQDALWTIFVFDGAAEAYRQVSELEAGSDDNADFEGTDALDVIRQLP